MTHAGLPVISGTRHLFVMSFSLVRNRPGAFERQPTPSPPEDTKPEVAEGTEIADGLADFADLFMGRGTLADRARSSTLGCAGVCTAVEDEVFDERFEVSEALYSLASAQGPSKEAVATLHTFGMI